MFKRKADWIGLSSSSSAGLAQSTFDRSIDDISDQIDSKEYKESQDTGSDIVDIHISRSRPGLSDLDRKTDHNDDREDIKKRDKQLCVMLGKPFEDRLYHQKHTETEDPNDQKMQLFICQIKSVIVVYGQKFRMKFRDERYEVVDQSVHTKTSYMFNL